jgi:hypothetical protein
VKKMDLEGWRNDFTDIVQEMRQFEAQGRPAPIEADGLRVDAHTPLISGHIARITMPKEDAEKCEAMLDLAWALSFVAAMSGAAWAPYLLPDHDHDVWDRIAQWAAVENWVQEQARLLVIEVCGGYVSD